MSDYVKNRSEIIFMYDIKDANPNGDPLDENKPRIDEDTGINLVTDVRLKRTIRDYLYNFKSRDEIPDIFVREIEYKEGKIQDAKLRAEDFLIKDDVKLNNATISLAEMKNIINKNILQKCIDVRLFGVTLPIEKEKLAKKTDKKPDSKSKPEKSSITHTGPVQFKIGRSLHKVFPKHFKGTGAFASGKDAEQKTFREEEFLPYSLICFYGIINENAAQETELTELDVKYLLDGIWNGTKNLISRSKAGQMPRLLIKINYNESNFHIGDLNNLVKKASEKIPDSEIRDISQIPIDITKLVDILKENKGKIRDIDYKVDDRLVMIYNNEIKKDDKKEKVQLPVSFDKCLEKVGIKHNLISF
jgi:CRISPR-associated protein Csh2